MSADNRIPSKEFVKRAIEGQLTPRDLRRKYAETREKYGSEGIYDYMWVNEGLTKAARTLESRMGQPATSGRDERKRRAAAERLANNRNIYDDRGTGFKSLQWLFRRDNFYVEE